MEINQLLSSLHSGDAIGNQAIHIQQALQSRSYESKIYVGGAQEQVAHLCHRFEEHRTRGSPDNVLIYHHCIGGTEAFRYFLTVPDRKVVIYHNITPAHFFLGFSRPLFDAAHQGRQELAQLRDVVCKALADSEYNREELEELGFSDVGILPLSIDREGLDSVTPNPYVMDFFDEGYENLLFVGRITPNKRQDQLIRCFEHYRKQINPLSRLFLVGSYSGMEAYCNSLLRLMGEMKARNIILAGHISLSELAAYYKLADVFVCLSEHEGFCVPLLESMHFEVPIVALDSTGVTHTLRGTGVLLSDNREESVASAVRALLEDDTRRQEILGRQRRRLKDFDSRKVESILYRFIQEIVNGA